MVWCLWQARKRYILILLALFGILVTASEAPDRQEGMGSIDCPHSLTVQWNNIPARPPYVENSTGVFDGLLPSNVFGIFHAFPVTFLSILNFFFSLLFTNCCLKGLFRAPSVLCNFDFAFAKAREALLDFGIVPQTRLCANLFVI